MSAGQGGRVRLEIDGHLAWVTLSHPGRLNAITVGMWGELRAVFDQLAADNALRCVIVRGEGGNFAAGADIREFPAERADMAGVQRYHREVLAPALAAVAACPHPVVAQIEVRGRRTGDRQPVRPAHRRRVRAFRRADQPPGFSDGADEMRGLIALAGRAAALAILLEGRVFGADEARGLGLLTRVVDDAQVATEARRSAERIAQGAPLAARINKRLSRRLAEGGPLSEDEYRDYFSYAESRDHQEGVRAFLAGEDPTFTGD